jgi:hypothetical protein
VGSVIVVLVAREVVDAVVMVPGESFPDDNVFAGEVFAGVSVGAETDCAGAGD